MQDPSPHAPTQPAARAHPYCEAEHHRPSRRSIVEVNGIRYGTCRSCGCDLMRTGASRHWFRSGMLG